MSAFRIEGHILTPQGFVRGTLEHENGRIRRIEGAPRTEDQARTEARTLVLPGFIDPHVHGGGGRDTMEGGDAIERIARLHARHGTTSLLATTMTAPLAEVRSGDASAGSRLRAAARAPRRACWACTWKARTSIPASSVRSPTSSAPRRSRKSARCTRSRRSG